MALARWNGVVQDAEGNAVSGAQIEVRSEATGGLAPLYADRDGAVGLGNPYVAAGPEIAFHARGGNYRIKASKGSELKAWRWVAIGTTQAVDVDDLIVGLQAGIITAQTLAELNANAPETPDPGITPAPRGGVVWADPNPALNGYYTYNYTATEWEYARPLPDTFAKVLLSGTGAAQTGVLAAGVSPAGIEVFFAKVVVANTGGLTLSINGGPARPVVNLAGNPLSAGEWTGMVMFYLNEDGQYQLLIDAGSAAAAAQSATAAATAQAAAEEAAAGAGVTDGDKGGITVSNSGTKWELARDRKTVALLLSDTVFSYTSVEGKSLVAPGDIVTAQGFRYEVAASDAADAHVETAGGVKLYEAGFVFTHIDRLARVSGSDELSFAQLTHSGRDGEFVWDGDDLSAAVALDTGRGIYVAPAVDVTGASGAWVRQVAGGEYQIDWFLSGLSTGAARSSAIVNLVENVIPAGARLSFLPKVYEVDPIEIDLPGNLAIEGNGATLSCPGLDPVNDEAMFLLTGDGANTISITGLTFSGPRLTTDTDTPVQGGGLKLWNMGVVTIERCASHGSFFNGIQVRVAEKATIQNCTVYNHGYGGILVNDCDQAIISNNLVDDIGAFGPTYGYGISAATSSTGANNNFVDISQNKITRIKRKGIDVHSARTAIINQNYIKGCLFSFIEAINESNLKLVGSILISNNILVGDAAFGASSTGISIGSAGPSVVANSSFQVHHNHFEKVECVNGIQVGSNTTTGMLTNAIMITGNTMAECSCSARILLFSNATTRHRFAAVTDNIFGSSSGTAAVVIQATDRVLASGNIVNGTMTATRAVTLASVTNSMVRDNMLNGVIDT
jgi:parallel beta-helix repeat protein